jgi:hypothetical protein
MCVTCVSAVTTSASFAPSVVAAVASAGATAVHRRLRPGDPAPEAAGEEPAPARRGRRRR